MDKGFDADSIHVFFGKKKLLSFWRNWESKSISGKNNTIRVPQLNLHNHVIERHFIYLKEISHSGILRLVEKFSKILESSRDYGNCRGSDID